MEKKTLIALEGSIRKWERIVEKKDIDKGIINCPLCILFHSSHCKNCPVRKKSKRRICFNTPYIAYMNKRSTANAKAELEFLKSLLPKKTKK